MYKKMYIFLDFPSTALSTFMEHHQMRLHHALILWKKLFIYQRITCNPPPPTTKSRKAA
jgi:hypothetical protein